LYEPGEPLAVSRIEEFIQPLPPTVIGAEGMGVTVIDVVVADAALPHVFNGVTETVPEAEPIVTVIEFVFEPEVITEPDGTLQV